MRFATLLLTVVMQERFGAGDWLSDFTRSQTERIINQREEPVETSRFFGTVFLFEDDRAEEILVEVHREKTGRVYVALTNPKGEFRLQWLPRGKYKYKITRNGVPSEVGDLTIRRGKAVALVAKLKAGV